MLATWQTYRDPSEKGKEKRRIRSWIRRNGVECVRRSAAGLDFGRLKDEFTRICLIGSRICQLPEFIYLAGGNVKKFVPLLDENGLEIVPSTDEIGSFIIWSLQ
ncbi:hypothetical protein RJT34_30844 [Clitoria ternatea]|uniref:Uncharacterized protein n=1 Tax=Clitoria ternatea TaxID=43366 RepID=A0AAN9I2D0_CLITE